jgi:polyhydroxybutyrate depolymerase
VVAGSLISGGRTRTWRLFVPGGSAHSMWSLVIVLHGGGGQVEGMVDITHFDQVAATNGFLVVYPDGVDRYWADGRGTTPADKAHVDDVAFLSSMIDQLATRYPIDPNRVFATGLSNGGFMSMRLACELSDRIAAVAPVAAALPTNLSHTCAPTRPVSILEIQGTEDPLVPYEGGEITGPNGGQTLSATDSAARWAKLDRCGQPRYVPIFTGSAGATTIRGTTYDDCRDGSQVQLLTVEHGGHTWPGGEQYLPVGIIGRTSDLIDASQEMWTFFDKHPRR